MLPHERSLVERLAGRPFALLGVNSDGTHDAKRRDEYLKKVKEHGVTWRSFRNESTEPSISSAWNVTAWPTLYAIDHRGIIIAKTEGELEPIVEAVEAALLDAEKQRRSK